MRCQLLFCGALAATILASQAGTAGACGPVSARHFMLAKEAISPDQQVAQRAIEALRSAGPSGLEALLLVHGSQVAAHATPQTELQLLLAKAASRKSADASPAADADEAQWQRLRAALTAVGGQNDCFVSKLYWYTDLEQALQVGRETHKPVLSLRLLGKLTDERSCANSRFFRSTLYANTEISNVLRERFVLHWQSVRPVPVITIDFGDGRKLERTVTGNSVHYVLDEQGRPIEALPGLYGPAAFQSWLQRSEGLAASLRQSPDTHGDTLAAYHRQRMEAIDRAWSEDTKRAGLSSADGAPTPEKIDDVAWAHIAALHIAEAELDEASRQLIANQNPTAGQAAPLARTKMIAESPLVRVIRNLQGATALDAVRNEYLFHRQLHQWFAGGDVGQVDELNERVYADLFLTPSSDPWLGLLPYSTYSALQNNGVVGR